MSSKPILLLWVIVALPLISFAQSSPVLDRYIQYGVAHNLMLQQKDFDVRKSMEGVRLAKAMFQPSVQLVANYTLAAGGRKIDFPIGDLLNPVYGTLNQLTQSNNFPLLENQQIQFLPNNFQETKVKFAYPLYNTDLRYNQKIQELLLQSHQVQRKTYELQLRYDIAGAYLQYLQAGAAAQIWKNAREVLGDLKQFNESLVKNNVATRDIVAQTEYEISKAEQELIALQGNQKTAQAYLNFLLNTPLQDSVESDTTLLYAAAIPACSLDSAIYIAQQFRLEPEALGAARQAGQTAADLHSAHRNRPAFYIGGEAGFQGFGYHYGQDQAFALVQAGMTYNVFDGKTSRIKAQEAQIGADQLDQQIALVQQQIALQVAERYYALESAQKRLVSARTGVQAAEASFRIIQNKYRAGQTLLIEWTDARNRVTTARLQELLARSAVLQAHWELQEAMGI